LKQIRERKQRRILIVLRTPTFPAYMRCAHHVVLQRLDEAALANAWITRE